MILIPNRTSRPYHRVAACGKIISDKVANPKTLRAFVVSVALMASGCSGSGGAGPSIAPNSGGATSTNARAITPHSMAYLQGPTVVSRSQSSSVAGSNGVYTYGGSAFPRSTYQESNYWVDVIFQPTTGSPENLFNPSSTPGTITENDPQAVELGVQFQSSVAGTVLGIRFYKGPQNRGTHIGNLWNTSGTRLGKATFMNETASGWQQVKFASPVSIAANTTYVASYHTTVGYYSADNSYFSNCRTNGSLTALGPSPCIALGPTPSPSPTPSSSASPSPLPSASPGSLAYNLQTACINHASYTNTLLPTSSVAPHGEGEFDLDGLDGAYWGGMKERRESVNVQQTYDWGPGYYTSWGRHQYDTWWSDPSDGKGLPNPITIANDSSVSPSVQALRIMANVMPAPAPANVAGADYYAGDVETELNNAEYGFFVARERLPAYLPAVSPAFWMLEEDVPQLSSGAQDDEQDIEEQFANASGNALNANQIVWNNANTGVPEGAGMYSFLSGQTPQNAYHDYGVLLTPQGTSFYLDGNPIPGDSGLPNHTAGGKDKEIMLMFQVAAPGSWLDPNSQGKSNPWPLYMWVQWIRGYQPTSKSC